MPHPIFIDKQPNGRAVHGFGLIAHVHRQLNEAAPPKLKISKITCLFMVVET
jgi:hypothetical protein